MNKITHYPTLLALGALSLGLAPTSDAFANKISPGTISVKDVDEESYAGLAKASLADAVEAAQKQSSDAKVIEAKLDEKDDFLVYHVKMMGPGNKMHVVVLDAGNLAVLKSREKNK